MASSSSPLVLVTGVNGYIASAAALQFLAAGYRVRGTVRSIAQSQRSLSEAFQDHITAGTLELIEVPDIFTRGALDVAVKDVVGIAHIASAGIRSEDLADPAAAVAQSKQGIANILHSAEANAGPQLRSISLLSSLAAMMRLEDPPGYRYTGDEFNPDYIPLALSMGAESPMGLTYAAVKAAVEQGFWDFINAPDRTSSFVGVSVNPSFVIGPVVARPEDPQKLAPSVRSIWHIFGGGAWPAEFRTPAFVDVRDVAKAVVLGVESPDKVSGQRLLLSAYKGSVQAVGDILRAEFPDRRDVIRPGNPEGARSPDDVSWGDEDVGMDGSRFERISGQNYVSYRDSVVATAKSMVPYLEAGKDRELGDDVPELSF